ncbi:RDD family protein [uncultured Pseudokineococcus sp.]|uniref:RDD family protein n=1 Tax=uncultured Pseudokineococcus sp. TaxID=1642928 RepID=UPI002613C018|nr:RDD family protein [uncultured Pseudokineococcus sp.]
MTTTGDAARVRGEAGASWEDEALAHALGTGVVTGDAVVLELPRASAVLRIASGLLDALVVLVVGFVVLVVALPRLGGANTSSVATVVSVLLVLLVVGIPTAVETLTRGRSLGRLVMGTRVVRDDGGPVRFRHAVVRALTGVGELWLLTGAPALITALANRRGKRIGDLLAGTVVVRERAARQEVREVLMPPELARWASTADVGALPAGLALACRQLLARSHRLNPTSREQLGAELRADVVARVFPPPPPSASPERVLAAVLAERRRRDLERLRAQEERRRQDADELQRLPFS